MVTGKYWKYTSGGIDWYYAAWADYYNDIRYSGTNTMDWRLTDLGASAYIADGMCHNK